MILQHRPRTSMAVPRLRTATAVDGPLVARLLAELSPASAYARFLTGLGGSVSGRLVAALLPEPPAGGAVLAFLDGEPVGHGLWARLPDLAVAEIAIVVADGHQRRGIGTALADAVTADLAAHGVTGVEVFSATGNRAVARMVARAAPDARRELDGPTATYRFPARSRAGQLPRTA